MDIIKEYIRDEDENKYSGISDNLKCYNDFDNYLKYGNFNIYEKCLY